MIMWYTSVYMVVIFIFMGCITTLSVARLRSPLIGWEMNDDLERIWEWVGYNRGRIPEFSLRDWGRPLKASARVAGAPTEIRIDHFPNGSLEDYRCAHLLSIVDLWVLIRYNDFVSTAQVILLPRDEDTVTRSGYLRMLLQLQILLSN
jgi:hypothetical protein